MGLKNFALSAGIFIIFVLFVAYAIQAFYPSPEYNNFCNATHLFPKTPVLAEKEIECTPNITIDKKTEECYRQQGSPYYEYDTNNCPISVNCDFCSKEFNEAEKKYSGKIFIITIIVGIITIGIGALLFSIETIGAGLMAGGVGTIIYGSVRNWQNLSSYIRVILLFLALIFLIYIGIRMNKKLK